MKKLIGTVVSTKMEKTVVVEVERIFSHKLYGKQIRRTKRYKAHNERFNLKEGDKVVIKQTRPISKEKNFMVAEVLNKG